MAARDEFDVVVVNDEVQAVVDRLVELLVAPAEVPHSSVSGVSE
jgi:guanylate kinase